MVCGNKEHKLHLCGLCDNWTVDVNFNMIKMSEKCKLCKSGNCQFESYDKYR